MINGKLTGLWIAAAVAVAAPAVARETPFAPADTFCEVGAYRSASGNVAALNKREKGWRYQFIDGRFGYTNADNPLAFCGAGGLNVKQPNGEIETWPKVAIRHTPTRFKSEGATLSGVLIEPEGVRDPPLAVYVHGSNTNGWIDGSSSDPYFMAATGISSFLFDKRGTGQSTGVYSQDLRALGRDVSAGLAEAKRLSAGRSSRVGLYGLSQGGWVAPLAAEASGGDFMVIGYAGVFSPLEEDSGEVFAGLRAKGYGEDVLAKAREVTEATHAVMASHFERGYEQLAAVKAKYGSEPWFADLKGEFTGDLVRASEAHLRANGRAEFDNLGIDWEFDPVPVVRSLKMPILWIVGLEDRDSPLPLTLARLDKLQAEGRPLMVARFPNADHGIYEFEQKPDGSRTYTRVADGYYRLVTDWITNRVKPPYGRAILAPAPAAR